MHCTIGGNCVKVLGRALQSLARLGKDNIYLEPSETCFCVRTINSSHSAFGVFTFPQSFFVKYWVETEVDPAFNMKLLHCRLSVKSVQGIVRSLNVPKHVESCTFTIKPDEDRVKVELHCRFKVAKVQFIPVIAWETMELQIGRTTGMANRFTATAKQFTDVLVNFYPNPNDITIIVTSQNLLLQNYIDGTRDPKKERRTEMFLHAGEFYDYHVDQKSQVTFNVKDWRAVLSFAGAFTLPLSINFQKAGRPVVFKMQREGMFEAEFVLSTVLPLDDVPASEKTIPDSALVISKKLAEKQKNVELYKALERKRITTLNKACESKAARSHSESRPGKRAAECSAVSASDISSLDLLSEWLPEENGRSKPQKRSFTETVDSDGKQPARMAERAAGKTTVGTEGEGVSVNLDDNLDQGVPTNNGSVLDQSEADCDSRRHGNIREKSSGKKLKKCWTVGEVCGETPTNSLFPSPHSLAEKIDTVFRCCFNEPFDKTKVPGYEVVLAEDSDGESVR